MDITVQTGQVNKYEKAIIFYYDTFYSYWL